MRLSTRAWHIPSLCQLFVYGAWKLDGHDTLHDAAARFKYLFSN